jgi:tetratricopeptide (TPR) repeat protein
MSKSHGNAAWHPSRVIFRGVALVALLLLFSPAAQTFAQTSDSYETERARAARLLDEGRFLDALPVFEKLSKEQPKDAYVAFGLGFSTLAKANTEKDLEARKQGRIRARTILVRAKELGYDHPLLHSLLEAVRPDGESSETFSRNKAADEAMREGEAAFVQGDVDKALAAYQRALQLDPQLYEAALFAGDMYNKKGQLEQAGEWFARAIKINPERETAYRYWGIGYMNQDKMLEARDKFIEAFITEPYNRLAINNLVGWAQLNKVALNHPKIEIPTSVSPMEKGQMTITIDPKSSPSWTLYGLSRAAWTTNNNARFAKEYPNEKTYRHSLPEEAAALRLVAEAAAKDLKSGKVKALDPSLANLVKLNEAGLLEAYILLARPDEGIVLDYAAYRKTNRDKLRRYVVEFVIANQ